MPETWLVLYEYGDDFVLTHRLTFPESYTIDEVKEHTHRWIDGRSGKTKWRVTYTRLVTSEDYENK